jgi:ribosomal protein S3AE
VFSLGQTAANRGSGDARRRFEIGRGTLTAGHNESSRSKKKFRIADYDAEHAGTRFSHAKLAIVAARFFL